MRVGSAFSEYIWGSDSSTYMDCTNSESSSLTCSICSTISDVIVRTVNIDLYSDQWIDDSKSFLEITAPLCLDCYDTRWDLDGVISDVLMASIWDKIRENIEDSKKLGIEVLEESSSKTKRYES